MKERKEAYEKRRNELLERCRHCTAFNSPTPECCECCNTGEKLRWLEAEYSDVTGWKHGRMWKKEV